MPFARVEEVLFVLLGAEMHPKNDFKNNLLNDGGSEMQAPKWMWWSVGVLRKDRELKPYKTEINQSILEAIKKHSTIISQMIRQLMLIPHSSMMEHQEEFLGSKESTMSLS